MSEPSQERRRLPRWTAWALGLLALLMLTMLAAALLLPRWIQGGGARLASEALGREVGIAAARFQPWRLALVLEGVTVAGAEPGAEPLLTLARADIALSLRSIRHLSPVLESLTLERPVLRLARLGPGRYDIDDLLARFAGPPGHPPQADAPPPALALYNIRLGEGRIVLDDRPVGRRHELSELQLELPFLSTLDTHVEVQVLPRLSGRLDGVAFGSQAEVLPFADSHDATLDFHLDGLDLAPFAPYLPEGLPLRLQRGTLDARVALHFSQAQGQAAQLQLRGELGLREFALQTPDGTPWLAWRALRIGLRDVQPLRRQVQLGTVSWTAPALSLRRDAAGRVGLPGAGTAQADEAPAMPWTFGLDRFELSEATLDWQDAQARAAFKADAIEARLDTLSWPLTQTAPLQFALRLQPPAGKGEAARLSGSGRLGADQLALDWQWQDLALEWLAPYVRQQTSARIRGLFAGHGKLSIERPVEADAAGRALVQLSELGVRGLVVAGEQPLLNLAAVGLDTLQIDAGERRIRAGTLKLEQPAVQLARAADGRLSIDALLPQPAPESSPERPAAAEPAWTLQLAAFQLERGSLQWRDAQAGTDVAVEQIRAQVQNLAWPARAGQALPASLSLKLGAPKGRAAAQGSVQWQGRLGLAPLAASGALRLDRLPLQLLDGYLDPGWGLHLRRAELGLRGEFGLQLGSDGLQAQLGGDLLLADLRLQQARQVDGQRVIGENLLSWQALNLDGFKLALAPGTAARFDVAEARLNDFYARLIVDESGRFNLRDIGPQERAEARAAEAAASAAPAAPGSSALIAIRQTRLSKGQVDFNDRFIRPNYSARLSELGGSLGAFASGKPEMAPLTLRGRVAGTGVLEIDGRLNPAGAPLALDITAAASDIELAPLSPYAAKYAGYAIERGKFSTRVQYKVDPDGALQARNQIILNQLTFGEKVDGPDATQLPVLLAVALLKDRNGVIDVDLPISGSVSDPDFSVGGLVLKLIVNLLGKALSAPFSLFAGGDAGDPSQIGFAAGSAAPTTPAQLDTVARMLDERPGLNLTITGWADAALERTALRERQLEDALRAERRRELRRQQTAAADAQAAAALPLGEAERARLLQAVYDAAKLPDKPRNLLGLAKRVPPAEMRERLMASYTVGEERVRELALQRGVALRDALIERGIPNARIFLAAPRLQEAAGRAEGWVPHAELALSAQ